MIKVLITDDHGVVRRGLKFYLGTQPDIEIVGEASNGHEAIRKVEELKPDVVLMDLLMPEMDGIEATKTLKNEQPMVKVIVLTSFSEQDHVLPAIRSGAVGYLLKDVEPDQLAEAIRGVIKGDVQLHPKIANQLMTHVVQPEKDIRLTYFDSLTVREKEVLCEIAKGQSNKDIATVLFITEKTVKTHVSNILSKLDLADRTQVALFAVKHGFCNE